MLLVAGIFFATWRSIRADTEMGAWAKLASAVMMLIFAALGIVYLAYWIAAAVTDIQERRANAAPFTKVLRATADLSRSMSYMTPAERASYTARMWGALDAEADHELLPCGVERGWAKAWILRNQVVSTDTDQQTGDTVSTTYLTPIRDGADRERVTALYRWLAGEGAIEYGRPGVGPKVIDDARLGELLS
jgi:hypothetical protein